MKTEQSEDEGEKPLFDDRRDTKVSDSLSLCEEY